VISVVIPLYNKAATIEATVRSVLAQTWSEFELLVIDDGSSDGGAALVQAIRDPRLRLVAQPNAGVSAARNRGAELARHELIAFLDADDLWDPWHLDDLARLATAHPLATLYATAYTVIAEHGAARPIRLRSWSHDSEFGLIEDYFRDIVEIEHPVHVSAAMVRRSRFFAAGGFPVGVKAGEDLIACARLACAGPLAYARRPSASYRLPPISAARSADAIRHPQRPDVVATELQRLQQCCPRMAPSIRRFRGEWHRIRAMLFLELGDRLACLGELARAIGAAGLRRRDIASVGLLLFPLAWRRQLLARWRLHFGRVRPAP
jgi:hypothetical protein